MATYFSALHACNRAGELRYYPGSPVLARQLAQEVGRRAGDRLVGFLGPEGRAGPGETLRQAEAMPTGNAGGMAANGPGGRLARTTIAHHDAAADCCGARFRSGLLPPSTRRSSIAESQAK